jgi:AcrR family transcriptional regulator
VKSKPKTRPSVSRDERRRELLDAARILFGDKGYHDTTVDDITRAANVAKGTFYLYFGEKREIYHEVIRSFLELIKEVGDLATQPMPGPNAFFDRAHDGVRRLLEILGDNRSLARMAYRESMGLDDTLARMMHDFYREIAEVEARNIQLAISLGLLRPCHPLLVAYVHIGMVERTLLELLEHPDDFPPINEVVDELLRINYDGLRGPNAPPWQLIAHPLSSTGGGGTDGGDRDGGDRGPGDSSSGQPS